METLAPVSPRQSDEEIIECWDNDGDLQCVNSIQFRTASTNTSLTGWSSRRSGHRDSISSRLSGRSDRESVCGSDADWQVSLHGNDETATQEAIATVKSAGIEIPPNLPKSALLGGTIKRLGGKNSRKARGEDWSDDMDLGGLDGSLELKLKHRTPGSPGSTKEFDLEIGSFPEHNASQDPFTDARRGNPPCSKLHTSSVLDVFHDDDNDGSLHDVPTIKVAKSRSPVKATPSAHRIEAFREQESFEDDLELPQDGAPLTLSRQKEIPRTPGHLPDDYDADWAEGSIGIRFGGTKRDSRSNRSSSISALSPSVSSCLTAESEDEGLAGLILPDGPLDLDETLKKRQRVGFTDLQTPSARRSIRERSVGRDDFFSGIDLGDGDVFDPGKLTLNRNIKVRAVRPRSPARRTATTVTFTDKPLSAGTRIPRLSGHERPRSTHLEPVSESGAPLHQAQRPHSRLAATHSSHSSASGITAGSGILNTLSASSTTGRRSLGTRTSREALRTDRGEPTTTGAQLLKAKRSMPAMRNVQHSRGSSFHRPSSRQDGNSRPTSGSRPKTPVDRSITESRLDTARRPQAPFLPAGASSSQSQHVSVKSVRQSRRNNSDGVGDMISNHRSVSRLYNLRRPETPRHVTADIASETLAAAAKRTVTRPNRRRNFGDGSELEIFDDLPTSASTEYKFVKPPVGRGAPRALRTKLMQSHVTLPPRNETPVPPGTPSSPLKPGFTPRFARDTAASRNAREQRIASMNLHSKDREPAPLGPLSANWKAHSTSRTVVSPTATRSKKTKVPTRPHLIKPIGTGVQEAKSIKGMQYNPALFKWEGNENSVAGFETVSSSRSPKSAPALITNVGAMQGVQVVGGMVFDPQRMCWLKINPSQPGNDGFAISPGDEDDVFAGLDELDDKPKTRPESDRSPSSHIHGQTPGHMDDRSGESADEWPITEEFDVGPEFIRRQRVEEEKWRRKVGKWIRADRQDNEAWKSAIRDLVLSNGPL